MNLGPNTSCKVGRSGCLFAMESRSCYRRYIQKSCANQVQKDVKIKFKKYCNTQDFGYLSTGKALEIFHNVQSVDIYDHVTVVYTIVNAAIYFCLIYYLISIKKDSNHNFTYIVHVHKFYRTDMHNHNT